jgi:hypothetical protein
MTEVRVIPDKFAEQAHAADRGAHRVVAGARRLALVRECARTLARETR